MGARLTVAQPQPETEPEAIIRDYWAAAKARYMNGDYWDYGSPEWRALPPEDPRKMAGLVDFAQMWMRYGDDIARNLNQALNQPPLYQRATTEACEKAFQQLAAQQQRRKEAA
ncbi:hypothetical protein AB0O39_03425 [Streptomyces anulatus]|uniref:hypothetical protein n=1 Tax=Streptomyces anulatus TaxID=1892 RepID=UPI00343BB56B